MGIYISKKTYTPEVGLSCCYRQWQAEDSKNKLHGYALSFTFTFECQQLDETGVSLNFSKFGDIENWLRDQFDHKTCVAEDDPHVNTFKVLEAHGLCDLRLLPGVGCEKFAEHVFDYVNAWLYDRLISPRIVIRTVECKEHDGNSAAYIGNI